MNTPPAEISARALSGAGSGFRARVHGRSARGTWVLALSLAAAFGSAARAAETEPNGLIVPQPIPAAEATAAASLVPPSEIRVDRLLVSRQEMLDAQVDAHALPGTFSPLCGITGQLLLRGGTCNVDFGWYNVVASQTTPPTADQIYVLVPAAPTPAGQQSLPDYKPGVGDVTPSYSLDAIRQDARYLGGLIGFAMIGDDKNSPAVCTQTHFSQPALNPVCTLASCLAQPPGSQSWIASLTYQSLATPNAYYLAFEEQPMSVGDFGNDGDFNDQVFFVSGVTCDGAGVACDTKKLGVCAVGTTACGVAGALTCAQNVQPSAEVCDGLDNDCDGIVDPPGTACADSTQLCDRGQCVAPCDDAQNPCPSGEICDQGLCKNSTCVGVVCAPGKLCVGGVCQAPCTNVTCPQGQACRANRCVDPCAGVTCATNQVCEGGACVPSCACQACGAGLACGQTGHCVDSGCERMDCGDTMVCMKGTCRSLCYFVECPADEFCSMGSCIPVPPPQSGTGGASGGLPDGGLHGTGGASGQAGDDGSVDGDGIVHRTGGVSTCKCDTGGAPRGLAGWGVAAVAFAVAFRRRRAR